MLITIKHDKSSGFQNGPNFAKMGHTTPKQQSTPQTLMELQSIVSIDHLSHKTNASLFEYGKVPTNPGSTFRQGKPSFLTILMKSK